MAHRLVCRSRAALLIAAAVLFLAACDQKEALPARTPEPTAATLAPVAQIHAATVAPPSPAVDVEAATSTPVAIASSPTQPSASTAVKPASPTVTSVPTPTPAPEPLSVTLTPVADLALGRGFNADVWEFNGTAYVGTFGIGSSCPATGVRMVDVHDPASPRLLGSVAAISGTSQEDVVVRHVSTPSFTGDLLATGIQRCDKSGQGGVSLYDVTDPQSPVQLGFFATGAARGVHELDVVQQGSRALALLAVPASESGGGDGDFRIVDVSDPRRPVQLADWGVQKALGIDLRGGIGCRHAIFDHSARASSDPNRVYLSYWDAGVIVLDISDPTTPRLLGRIQYGPDDEGETHSVAEAGNGRYLLIADEDGVFQPPSGLHFMVQTPGGPVQVYGCEALFSKPLAQTGVLNGDLVAVGSGCPNTRLLADAKGRVALVDAGSCSLEEQANRLSAAGAIALIAPSSGEPIAEPGGKDLDIPVVTVRAAEAAVLRAALGVGALPVKLPSEKHSSGLRIWDIADLSAPRQLAVYQTPDSMAFPSPGAGAYTVHNPEAAGDLAFLSWYSDGLRVVDISNPALSREVAAYVPSASANGRGAVFPDTTLVWGVHLDGDLIFLSDINSGLHIVRYSVRP